MVTPISYGAEGEKYTLSTLPPSSETPKTHWGSPHIGPTELTEIRSASKGLQILQGYERRDRQIVRIMNRVRP